MGTRRFQTRMRVIVQITRREITVNEWNSCSREEGRTRGEGGARLDIAKGFLNRREI